MAREDPELEALRDEGYRYLNRAIDEAGDQLRRDWWFDRDPDLDGLRDDARPEWRLLKRRFSGRPPKPAGTPESPWKPLVIGGEAVLAVGALVLVCALFIILGLWAIVVLAAPAVLAMLASSAKHLQHRGSGRLEPPVEPSKRQRRRRSGPDAQAAVDLWLARKLRRSGDTVTAEGAFRSAASRGRADAALELGDLLEQRKDVRGAIEAYKQAQSAARKHKDERTDIAATQALARLPSAR